jgi:hypothetical protein
VYLKLKAIVIMERVALRIPAEKKVTWIDKTHYEKVYDFILNELQFCNSLMLPELIERAAIKLNRQLPVNLNWMVLRVKQDMEVRGVIRTNLDFFRNQTITINREKNFIL